MTDTIPPTWSVSALKELGEWSGGGTPSKAIENFWNGNIPWVSPKDMKLDAISDSEDHISESAISSSAAKLIAINSIIFVTRSGILAHTFPVSINMVPVTVNQDIKALTPSDGIDTRYLAWLLRAKGRQVLETCSKDGTTVNSIETTRLHALLVPVAPLKEQLRIIAKIEELFSELDKGIENLKTAQAQLKVYRQALLKHAFEGKLTAQWRADNSDKLEIADALLKRIQKEREQRYQQQVAEWEAAGKPGSKPKALKPLAPLTTEELAELPQLPEGWGWSKLGNLANIIGGVTKGKNLDGKETISLPYLRVANVQDGYLNLAEIKHIDVEVQDKDKYRLVYGDVLYTEGGDKDKLGRGAVWRGQIESCIHQNHIFRARPFLSGIDSEVLSLFSQTKNAKKYFFRHGKQTTNLASINLTVLGNLPVAIFCKDEQRQVLLEIESCLSEVDQLEQTITTSLQQSEALRQSILKKAFSGQLVPQDPADEPASALLARIKAAKSTQPTSKKASK